MSVISLKRQLACCVLCLFLAFSAVAGMQQREVEWQLDGTAYSGVLVYADQGAARRPGLVMVPNWYGMTPAAVEQAKQMAGTDYVVLVADVYGKTIRPANSVEAGAAVQPLLANRRTLRLRAAAALDALKAQVDSTPLDTTRIAAVGFCFGGSTVLEMARAGLPLAGVVSLHGGLSTPLPAAAGSGTVPVLVLNGAADTTVSAEDIAGFGEEMERAGVDWQFVNFGRAVHCFAEETANSPPNCVYHPKAAKRARKMLTDFLQEWFGQSTETNSSVPQK